ncbi:MAG TPA: ABC transporter permease [Chitinophagaceae bacterium]|nr:ABC transporter permease [Chitinophagaceae bacterium]
MNNLIRTEWLKIRKYNAFWWIMGVTALAYPGINYIFYLGYQSLTHSESQAGKFATMLLGNPFTFPEVWHTVAYCSSIFVFIPSVVIIMFISNEFAYKTQRQNIIDGWSRNQFMSSKLIDVLITSVIITLLFVLVSFIWGASNFPVGKTEIFGQFYYVGLFALQTFAQLSLAFLVAYLVKKSFLSLGIFLFYFIILEPLLVFIFRNKVDDIGAFLPLEISDRIIPVPGFSRHISPEGYQRSLSEIQPHIFYTIALTALIWIICYRVNSKRNL